MNHETITDTTIEFAAYQLAKNVVRKTDLVNLFQETVNDLTKIMAKQDLSTILARTFILYLSGEILENVDATFDQNQPTQPVNEVVEKDLSPLTFASLIDLKKALNTLCLNMSPNDVTSFQNLARSILNARFSVPTLEDLSSDLYQEFYTLLVEEATVQNLFISEDSLVNA